MKLIKLSVVVLALVVCQVLSVPAPPSQPNPETVEKIKQAITRRAVAGDTAVPPTTTPDGDLQTDETFSIGVGYTGLGYPWGGGVGVGLGWGGWGYGGYGLGGYGGYGLGGYGGYGYPGWGGYGLGGYGGYGLGYGLG